MRVNKPHIHHCPLAYAPVLATRPQSAIDLVVVHCTELPDLATARRFGERVLYPESGSGNCGHFYIDRDGHVEQWAELNQIAHHVRGYNERSLGIELVNRGRYPDWLGATQQQMQEPYTELQILSLADLLVFLCDTLPSLRWLAGHEELDCELVPASDDPAVRVRRKLDPGPLFPWERIRGVCSLLPWPQKGLGKL